MTAFMAFFGQRKIVLLLGALALVNLALFSIPSFPGSQAKITANAPDQVIPDVRGVYTPQAVNTFLESIGPDGRAEYQRMHLTTDLTFPLVYGLFLFSLLSRLTLSLNLTTLALPWLGLVATVFDLAENFTLLFLTDRYPQVYPALTWLAQGFTIGKFALIAVSALAVLYLSLRWLFRPERN